MNVVMDTECGPYCCPNAPPGQIPQPHHIPGYAGHVPTIKSRSGKTFGNITREIIEDPCVAQSPIPILAPPMVKCPPLNSNCRNPTGCSDIGCWDPVDCPPQPQARKKQKQCGDTELNIPPCVEPCDPRAHHLNRGPYACPCRPEINGDIYRCCESMNASYTGHIPGFTFHSLGRTSQVASFGTKKYMQNCYYMNTFTK